MAVVQIQYGGRTVEAMFEPRRRYVALFIPDEEFYRKEAEFPSNVVGVVTFEELSNKISDEDLAKIMALRLIGEIWM